MLISMLLFKRVGSADHFLINGTDPVITKGRAVKRISTDLFATGEDLTAELKLKEGSFTKQEADHLVLHYRTMFNSLHL